MERLTYVTEDGEVLFHPGDLPEDRGITITQLAQEGRYKALEQIAERLANREQAEEQGLLLRLPCKAGDTVYKYHEEKAIILEYTIWSVCISAYVSGGIEIVIEGSAEDEEEVLDEFSLSALDFKKEFYLTKEEAEQALEEMKGV